MSPGIPRTRRRPGDCGPRREPSIPAPQRRWAWYHAAGRHRPWLGGNVLSYRALVEDSIRKLQAGIPDDYFPGVMVNFDNTARRQASPESGSGQIRSRSDAGSQPRSHLSPIAISTSGSSLSTPGTSGQKAPHWSRMTGSGRRSSSRSGMSPSADLGPPDVRVTDRCVVRRTHIASYARATSSQSYSSAARMRPSSPRAVAPTGSVSSAVIADATPLHRGSTSLSVPQSRG